MTESGEEFTVTYIEMERLNESLFDLLTKENRKLSENSVKYIAHELVQGVKEIHKRGFAH